MLKTIALTTLAAVSVVSAQQAEPAPATPAPTPTKEVKVEKPNVDSSKPYDVIFSKMVELMEGALTEINTVRDEATAMQAVAALKTMQPKSDALSLEMGKIGEPSIEAQKVLMEKWGPYFRIVIGNMMKAQMKLQKYPELAQAFNDLQPEPKKPEEKKEEPVKK